MDDASAHHPRGILKKSGNASGVNAEVKWDEIGIHEHDLTRGTRMKIDEPDTPFYQSTSLGTEEMEDALADEPKGVVMVATEGYLGAKVRPPPPPQGGIDMVALSSRLAVLQEPRKSFDSEVDEEEQGQDDDDHEEDKERKRKFAEMRRQHYDEFRVVKRMSRSGSLDEDDNDDDDEDQDVERADETDETREG